MAARTQFKVSHGIRTVLQTIFVPILCSISYIRSGRVLKKSQQRPHVYHLFVELRVCVLSGSHARMPECVCVRSASEAITRVAGFGCSSHRHPRPL
eukprot:4438047-Amphidinium_carterae.1